MKRLLVFLLLATFLSFNVTGCSLFGSSDDEAEAAEVADENEGLDDFEDGDESADAEDGEEGGEDDFSDDGEDVAEGDEEGGDDFAVEDDFQDDEFPDDEIGGDGGEVAEISDDDFSEVGGEEADGLFADEGGGEQELPAEPMSSNEEQDLFAAEDNSGGDSGSFYDPPGGSEPVAMDDGGGAMAGLVPVKKMKPEPFQRAGANVNRLYVTRQGDDMASIAQKIYGSDQSEELYKYNGHFRGKSLKVGDKVYYSSPNQPDDGVMKTYYEDIGVAPQYYTSQKGENIRAISKNLLGDDRSWMEVYATNPNVDSKWAIPAGTQLRYWDGSAGGGQTMAESAPVPAPEPAPEAPEDPQMDEVAMEEPMEEAAPEEIPPADPAEVQEVAQLDEPAEEIAEISEEEEFAPPPAAGSVAPPPPPSPGGVEPPPPPPVPLAQNAKPFKDKAINNANTDDSMIMGALGGLLILAALILLIFIRRSRAKRVNFSQTQV